MQQIIINLLGNAIKFTQQNGTVCLEITFGQEENDKIPLNISVSDTGVGIKSEFLPLIFEPFEQGETGMLSSSNGTGLGLAICKHLTDILGGKISVRSTENVGSEFIVELQLEPYNDSLPSDKKANFENTKTVSTFQSSQSAQNYTPFDSIEYNCCSFNGKRVLLVEDHDLNIEIVKKLLSAKGCKVDAAKNGLLAIKMFTETPSQYYDAILMDIRMPVMDGLTASKAIRNLDIKTAKTIPIIAMSANAFDEDIEKSMLAGMNAHLPKPIQPNFLYATLDRFLNSSQNTQ